MNILNRLTRRMLKKNPTRTWVTIIGIMLSMALTVAVLEGAYSGLQFMLNVTGQTDGYCHGYYYGLTETQAKEAMEQRAVKKSAAWQLVGWEAPRGDSGKAVCVDALQDGYADLIAVRLVGGRMPEKADELLLPLSFFDDPERTGKENTQAALDSIGQRKEMQLGERVRKDGTVLSEAEYPTGTDGEETIENLTAHTYTIVGIYRNFPSYIDQENAYFRALTAGEGTGEYRVFFTLKAPLFYRQFVRTQVVSGQIIANGEMLRYYGVSNSTLVVMLYGFAAVLVALVAFGSISLIYNSFAISVSQRTKQFGILRSIGATKKQIRAMVRHEALLLGAGGIVLGVALGLAGIGITLRVVSNMLIRMLPEDLAGGSVSMHLVISPVMLVIAAAVCLLTTLISARIPARRAVKMNVIDAIRQSSDVKLSPREVRTPAITRKLFGFEGEMASKNFKRDRKRYRATVLSLFLSIVLFVSASSLTAYLRDSIAGVYGDITDTDILVTFYDINPQTDPERIFQKLMDTESVTEGSFTVQFRVPVSFRTADMTKAYREVHEIPSDQPVWTETRTIAFLEDALFQKAAAADGENPERYFAETPMGRILNQTTGVYYQGGKRVLLELETVASAALPASVQAGTIYTPKGWILLEQSDIYIPEEVLSELGRKEGTQVLYEEQAYRQLHEPEGGRSPLEREARAYEQTGTYDSSIFNREKIRIVPEEEITASFDLVIGNAAKHTDPLIMQGQIFYPYSRMREVIPEQLLTAGDMQLSFSAENHARAAAAMLDDLETLKLRGYVSDLAEEMELERLLVTVVDIFAYGFIILISLIAAANVFNTISTSVMLRRREFAMLRSIGLSDRGFRKMLRYECLIYGLKSLLWGLPASVLVTYLIWTIQSTAIKGSFYIPWYSMAIAVFSVFAVTFATMLYAAHKIRNDNPIDALKNENL